jgi:hypothetical protein
MSFFSDKGYWQIKKAELLNSALPYIHKVYCWQVALQQSLLPRQLYNSKLTSILDNSINYFLHQYQDLRSFYPIED